MEGGRQEEADGQIDGGREKDGARDRWTDGDIQTDKNL